MAPLPEQSITLDPPILLLSRVDRSLLESMFWDRQVLWKMKWDIIDTHVENFNHRVSELEEALIEIL